MTKSELIELAKKNNIFYRKSWSKNRIKENIEKGITIGTKVFVFCDRSGLEFKLPVEKVRTKNVLPKFFYWLNLKDMDARSIAILVIEQGKKEGWKSYEIFVEKIRLALNPDLIEENIFKGKFASRITGYSPQYKFKRRFLDPIETKGEHKYFALKNAAEGIYEIISESENGNNIHTYYRLNTGGELEEITREEVEKLYPKESKAAIDFDLVVKENLGKIGDIINYENIWYTIKDITSKSTYLDEDGVLRDDYPEDAYVFQEYTNYKTYLKFATESEISDKEIETKNKEKIKKAKQELKNIYNSLLANSKKISPDNADYPKGIEYIVSQGLYQANENLIVTEGNLWSLKYNGRDGDNWDINNISKQWIGSYLEIDIKTQERIKSLINSANNKH